MNNNRHDHPCDRAEPSCTGTTAQPELLRRRTPQELIGIAHDWIRRTRWRTRAQDDAIAADVYRRWINATNAEWAITHSRNLELMANMLRAAFTGIRDDEAIDCLQILLSLDLVLRARQEGQLIRHRIH